MSAEKNMGGRMLLEGRREAWRGNAVREDNFSVMPMSKDWVELPSTSPLLLGNTQ
jgi:hypothetical protein